MASISNPSDISQLDTNLTKTKAESKETSPTLDSSPSPTLANFEPSILTPPTTSTSNSVDPTQLPSHLFWVPAHLHPEIAPQEFNRWLEKHSDAINTQERPTRRKSVLGLHSYTPKKDKNSINLDDVGKASLRRNKTMSANFVQGNLNRFFQNYLLTS